LARASVSVASALLTEIKVRARSCHYWQCARTSIANLPVNLTVFFCQPGRDRRLYYRLPPAAPLPQWLAGPGPSGGVRAAETKQKTAPGSRTEPQWQRRLGRLAGHCASATATLGSASGAASTGSGSHCQSGSHHVTTGSGSGSGNVATLAVSQVTGTGTHALIRLLALPLAL
jgi:hypothetical protein